MALRPFAFVGRWTGRLFWFLDASRRLLLNLLFLLVLLVVFAAFFKSTPPLLDKTTLVLALKGPLVEQRTGSVEENALAQIRGDVQQSTQLRDVLAALDAAGRDPQVVRVLLLLDDFQGSGMATLNDVAAAIERFKATGKQVVAWGSGYDQRGYYLAAHANEVYLHPMGQVELRGFGGYRNYYRDALDKLGIEVSLVRVGTYKSFAEPYIGNGPSDAAKEAEGFLYNALWSSYTDAIEHARKLPAGSTMALIDAAPERLAAVGGNAAQMALDAKLVDGLKTRDEIRQLLVDRGAKDVSGRSFRQVSFDEYVNRTVVKQRAKLTGDAVGVIVAEGEIVDGEAPAGTIGGLSTANLVRRAREDDGVKAIVLRVNSPGGSAFGSELVRRELDLTRRAGKPVVVSMGDVAASGGYWITTSSDEVVADASTITGSIGVFGLFPHGEKALEKLGVHTAGTTTTWLAAAGDPRVAPDPRFLAMVQSEIDHIYAEFTGKVAAARKTTAAKIDAVGQGRVWTGAQAKERGLVDTLGGIDAAVQSAARRARMNVSARSDGSSGVRVVYIEPEQSKFDRVLDLLNGNLARIVAQHIDAGVGAATGLPPAVVGGVRHDLGWLTQAASTGKPYATAAHCFCAAP